jgi:hypothetical protein
MTFGYGEVGRQILSFFSSEHQIWETIKMHLKTQKQGMSFQGI